MRIPRLIILFTLLLCISESFSSAPITTATPDTQILNRLDELSRYIITHDYSSDMDLVYTWIEANSKNMSMEMNMLLRNSFETESNRVIEFLLRFRKMNRIEIDLSQWTSSEGDNLNEIRDLLAFI